MTFSLVGSDNPFVPGGTFSAALDPQDGRNNVDRLNVSIVTMLEPPVWGNSYNSIFGNIFDYAANGDVTLKSAGGGGGSARPASGLVYPRLT